MAVLMREAIGATLRRARTARRRTLREVSRQARVSLGYLSEVERGRKEPSSELLAAICDALDVSLPELMTEAAGAIAESMAAAHVRGPVGLRHLDLRLAGAPDPLAPRPPASPPFSEPPLSTPPLSTAVPVGLPLLPTAPAAPPTARRPVGGVRVAA